jgi:hypothetical protein
MRVVVTSSTSWSDAQAVIDAVCELPASTVVLLPMKSGACKIILDNAEDLKFEIEDWSEEDLKYENNGSKINSEMLQSDVDVVIAFLSPGSHSAKDCTRQARNMFLDVKIITSS